MCGNLNMIFFNDNSVFINSDAKNFCNLLQSFGLQKCFNKDSRIQNNTVTGSVIDNIFNNNNIGFPSTLLTKDYFSEISIIFVVHPIPIQLQIQKLGF